MTVKRQPELLKRTIATFIDYGIYLVFFIWLVVNYGVPNDEGGYTLKNDPKGLWIFLVWFAYFPITESLQGQTLGKLILGLRVVTKAGNPISFSRAVKRRLLDFIDFFFFGIVAFLIVKNTPDHQRLGDLWAKTVVIGEGDVVCPNCKAPVTLNVNEIVKMEFVCPMCKTAVNVLEKKNTWLS
jgi:uncharacterized RDD family membrane protein YckC